MRVHRNPTRIACREAQNRNQFCPFLGFSFARFEVLTDRQPDGAECCADAGNQYNRLIG
jgi:hypothetical protein